MKNIKKIICFFCLNLVLCMSLTIFAGCFSSDNNEKVEVFDTTMSSEYNEYLECYSITIKGKVKNVSGEDLSYVSVEFSIYDNEGNLIGDAYANLSGLDEGETWKFEATSIDYPEEEPKTFKLKEITCW